MVDAAAEKEVALKAKIKTIGNIVDDSVPVSNNEVGAKWLDGTGRDVADMHPSG